MISNTKKLKISQEQYLDFVANEFGHFYLDGHKVFKSKNSSVLKNEYLNIELSFSEEENSTILSYYLSSDEKDEVEIYYLKKGIEKGIVQKMQKNENPFSRKKLIRIFLLMILMITIILLTIQYVFTDWEGISHGLSYLFVNANGWTAILFLRFISRAFISSISFLFIYKYILKKGTIKIRYLFFGSTIGFFLDQISPFWGPGLIFSIWYVNKKTENTTRLADIALTSLIWGTTVNLFFLVSSSILVPLAQLHYMDELNNPNMITIVSLAYIGIGWFALNVSFYLMLGFFTWFQNFMIWLLTFSMKLIGMSEKSEIAKERMIFEGKRLKKAYQISFGIWYLIPVSFLILLTSLSIGWLYFFSSFKTVSIIFSSFESTIFISTLVGSASTYIPIPGNVGFSEYYLIYLIEIALGGESSANKVVAEEITIVYRTMMTYLPMILGSLIFFGVMGRNKRQKI